MDGPAGIIVSDPGDMVGIGRVSGSFGVRGGARVRVITDFPGILRRGLDVFARADSVAPLLDMLYPCHSFSRSSLGCPSVSSSIPFLRLTVRSFHASNDVMFFYHIDSRDMSDELKGAELFCTKAYTVEHCDLKEGEFFHFHVVGLRVIEEGKVIGTVLDIMQIGNTSYFVLEGDALIPYIDRYVEEVNPDLGHIVTRDARFLIGM